MASDKLFFFLFQGNADLILRWLDDLPADAGGYSFSAPVLKEREYRLDGLFAPPPERPELPVVILEAQMAADPGFLLRLYAETGRFLQQRSWSGDWRVVVICPHRDLNFGNPTPIQEFLDRRVLWVELQPRDGQPPATPLARVLSLLLQPESQVRSLSDALREQALSDSRAAEVVPLIPAIVLTRFSDRPLSEICEMVGITLEDFTKSRAYQEIFGLGEARGKALGEARGKALGEARGEAKVTLRLLARRCGSLSAATTTRIEALPLEQLEALAEALLDFGGPDDLAAWLAAHS
jgi:predicted transposase YdaD